MKRVIISSEDLAVTIAQRYKEAAMEGTEGAYKRYRRFLNKCARDEGAESPEALEDWALSQVYDRISIRSDVNSSWAGSANIRREIDSMIDKGCTIADICDMLDEYEDQNILDPGDRSSLETFARESLKQSEMLFQ